MYSMHSNNVYVAMYVIMYVDMNEMDMVQVCAERHKDKYQYIKVSQCVFE